MVNFSTSLLVAIAVVLLSSASAYEVHHESNDVQPRLYNQPQREPFDRAIVGNLDLALDFVTNPDNSMYFITQFTAAVSLLTLSSIDS